MLHRVAKYMGGKHEIPGIKSIRNRPQLQEFAYDDDLLPSKW